MPFCMLIYCKAVAINPKTLNFAAMKKITLFLTLTCFSWVLSAQSADNSEYLVTAVGFYNLENLFDTIDSPTTNDADFMPHGRLLWNTEKYISKQANLAKVISLLGTELTPDGLAFLGVAEIENRKVLEDLVVQEPIKSRNYQIVHFDSPDERGIDCGLLYNPKYFSVQGAKPLPVNLQRAGDTVADYTRDVLYVAGLFNGEPMHIMVGHWPSRRGGESASAWMRAKAAGVCRAAVDSILKTDPYAKIVVMGDLNDDPNNKSLTEVLGAQKNTEGLRDKEMYNPMYDLFMAGNGTMAYRDAWSLFDQMVVSKGFVYKKVGGWQLYKAVVFRQPWLLQTEGAFRGYPFRTYIGDIFINGYSDHLPVFMYLLKKK